MFQHVVVLLVRDVDEVAQTVVAVAVAVAVAVVAIAVSLSLSLSLDEEEKTDDIFDCCKYLYCNEYDSATKKCKKLEKSRIYFLY